MDLAPHLVIDTSSDLRPVFAVITKRDGSREPFDAGRIERAIQAAGHATREFGSDEARALTRRVLAIAAATFADEPTVEGVQDLVEEVLIASPFRRAARAYILYREQHRVLREIQSTRQLELVDSYLDKSDWQVAENANMAFSLQVSPPAWRGPLFSGITGARVPRRHENGVERVLGRLWRAT
jgi:anaerobic ribonucleoside-triphosphate reductase